MTTLHYESQESQGCACLIHSSNPRAQHILGAQELFGEGISSPAPHNCKGHQGIAGITLEVVWPLLTSQPSLHGAALAVTGPLHVQVPSPACTPHTELDQAALTMGALPPLTSTPAGLVLGSLGVQTEGSTPLESPISLCNLTFRREADGSVFLAPGE